MKPSLQSWATNSLLLSPFEEKDIGESYLDTLNDKAYMRHSRQNRCCHTLADAQEYARVLRARGGELLAITDLASGEMVATVSLRPSDDGASCDLGLMTIKNQAAQGYGQASWNAVVTRLGSIDSLDKITAGTRAENVGMLRIIRRSGFTQIQQPMLNRSKRTHMLRFALWLRK